MRFPAGCTVGRPQDRLLRPAGALETTGRDFIGGLFSLKSDWSEKGGDAEILKRQCVYS
jgi:hypothetical protein